MICITAFCINVLYLDFFLPEKLSRVYRTKKTLLRASLPFININYHTNIAVFKIGSKGRELTGTVI
jgi:hypothetical protein